MSVSNILWFCAGVLLASGLAFIVPSIWRGMEARWSRNGKLAAVGLFAVAFTAISVGLYHLLGDPLAAARSANAAGAPHPVTTRSTDGRASGALDEATRKLAARLQQDGGTDQEWELLAQSYEYMGDAVAASAAREHRAGTRQVTAAESTRNDAAAFRQRVAGNPADAAAWLALAQLARAERRFPDAQASYEQVIALKAMTADTWADYADVLASSSGKLSGAPATAIARALALNAKHTKALWLHASLALEEKRYADALTGWKRLRSLIADSSPDAGIVDANIREAQALSSGSVPAVRTGAIVQRDAPVAIRGTVDVDPSLKASVTGDMTLFIYAKSVDTPGPPLAVLRTKPSGWPVSFQLDDTLSMLPNRQLSGFDRVIVEARLSKSGQALAQPGDLQALSDVVRTRDSRALTLRIAKVIG